MIRFIRKLFNKNNSEASNNCKHFFILRVDDVFLKAFNDLKELVDLSEEEVIKNALNLYGMSVIERIYNNKGIVFQDLEQSDE